MRDGGDVGSEALPRPTDGPRTDTTVDRPRLLDALRRAPSGAPILVVAPAGSGKSVLLDQWLADGGGGAKLTLEPRHDDAVVLARDLTDALRRSHPSIDPAVDGLVPAGADALGALFFEALWAELAAHDGPVLLALDDAHRLTSPTLVAELGTMATEAPAQVRVAISSRRDLALAVGRTRLRQLVEVRAHDLAFDAEEARGMVEEVSGTELAGGDLATLVAKTDGWAAGLQLAALSLQGADDATAFVERFQGDNRLVVDYLTEEVLEHQDPATRDFLLRTSVLASLAPEVCAALVPGCDSRAMLEDLERRSMFVVHQDGDPDLRYHHLFAELMRYRLRAEHPGMEKELRREAARHLRARGEVRRAIEQLLEAGEPMEAYAVIATDGHVLFERGEASSLVAWLESIVGSSRVDLQACKLEYSIVSPK